MKNNFSRLINILAAIDISKNDLADLIDTVKYTSTGDLIECVQSAKRVFSKNEVSDFASSQTNKNQTIRRDNKNDLSNDTQFRVIKLLRDDARLSTSFAIESMKNIVKQEYNMDIDSWIPKSAERSLKEWINRLETGLPAKDILRAATMIRNNISHSSPNDWALRESPSNADT